MTTVSFVLREALLTKGVEKAKEFWEDVKGGENLRHARGGDRERTPSERLTQTTSGFKLEGDYCKVLTLSSQEG